MAAVKTDNFLEKIAAGLPQVFSLLKERNNFFQNLSLLISSGTPLIESLGIVYDATKSVRFKKAVEDIRTSVEGGGKFWAALARYPHIFSAYEIRMVKVAEETGNFNKSLAYLADQLEKDLDLRSKIKSALIYPIMVSSFAVIIGLGVTWFVLPKLAKAFASLRVQLPFVTKLLLGIGSFVESYGLIVFPALIALFFAIVVIARFTGFKYFLISLAEKLPGIGGFLKDVRTARLSLLLGTLVDSGVPLVDSLRTLTNISETKKEKSFFTQLAARIETGDSFRASLPEIKGSLEIFPAVNQSMIFTAEKTGNLSRVFLYISALYEKRVDLGSKNLTQVLEPILLVGIAVVVAFIAIAIILPIYSLLGGLEMGPAPRLSPPPVEAAPAAPAEETPAPEPAAKPIPAPVPETPAKKIKILDTPTGFLNVRAGPSPDYKLLGKINPGEEYEFTAEEDGWFRIILSDAGNAGWISGRYAEEVK